MARYAFISLDADDRLGDALLTMTMNPQISGIPSAFLTESVKGIIKADA